MPGRIHLLDADGATACGTGRVRVDWTRDAALVTCTTCAGAVLRRRADAAPESAIARVALRRTAAEAGAAGGALDPGAG